MTITAPATVIGAPVGPGGLNGPKVSGRFYGPAITNVTVNSALTAANRLFAMPMWIGATSTALSLSFNIGTGIAGAWNARVGIYRDTGSGLPGALVTGTDTLVAVAGGGTTGVQTGTMNGATGIVLGGGAWYWLAFVADTSGQSLHSASGNTAWLIQTQQLGGGTAAQLNSGSATSSVYVAHAFAALPASFGTPTFNSNAATPYIAVGF